MTIDFRSRFHCRGFQPIRAVREVGCTGKANSTVGRHHDNEPRNVNDAVPFEENQSASLVVVGNKQGRRYITGTLGKKVNIMAKIIRMNDIFNKE